MKDFDICIVGSGAGAAPVAFTLAKAGYKVVVLEKGPWFKTSDFSKDEMAFSRRSVYTPNLKDEQHVIEEQDSEGNWVAESTFDSGWDFWNGSMVGGSSNLMSGYFHRLKPVDFRLLSEFGPVEGSNVADWPIDYETLEPYYALVEKEVGVSGKVIPHKFLEPRSTPDYPYPPLEVNEISNRIDRACIELNIESIPTARAILSKTVDKRNGCYYSNFCGSYGCSSDAKGSARAALLNKALETGNLEIRPFSRVYKLETGNDGKVKAAHYFDREGKKQSVDAKTYVVACQAIETSRLLMYSTGPKHPDGIGNNRGQLGKNLVFSGGGTGQGDIYFEGMDQEEIIALKMPGLFVNRSIQQWYEIDDPEFGARAKGGTIDFLWRHANGITRANLQKWDADGYLVWGKTLKRKMERYFTEQRHLRFEVFNDWMPNDNCFVTLDPRVKDKWDIPVARFRIGYSEQDLKVGNYLSDKAMQVLEQLGARNVYKSVSGYPPANLQAGGCRFGNDPATSVLDADCRVHDAPNLYVTDGSFMPTGGSVPYTFTIYANAFRVADIIKNNIEP